MTKVGLMRNKVKEHFDGSLKPPTCCAVRGKVRWRAGPNYGAERERGGVRGGRHAGRCSACVLARPTPAHDSAIAAGRRARGADRHPRGSLTLQNPQV